MELNSSDPVVLQRLLKEYKKENRRLHSSFAEVQGQANARAEEYLELRREVSEWRQD